MHPLADRAGLEPGRAGRARRAARTPTSRCWCSAASSTRSPPPAEGDLVAEQWPERAARVVANSFHVTAVGDTDRCAVLILRSFVAKPPGAAARGLREGGPAGARPRASSRSRSGPRRRSERVAKLTALTVADLQDRWWNNYSGHGVGLRGGTFTYTGDDASFRLRRLQLVKGLGVSGRAVWDRYGETMTVRLVFRTHGRTGTPPRLLGHPPSARPRRPRRHLDGARFRAPSPLPRPARRDSPRRSARRHAEILSRRSGTIPASARDGLAPLAVRDQLAAVERRRSR